MSTRLNKYRNSAAAEINIVPLLDVLLVLVAVLLLLTPFMAKSINVNLPAASASSVMTQDTSVTLEVHADGSIWHEGIQVSDWADLSLKMKGATAARVYADKGAAFSAITFVLDKLASNDIHNVQFGVKE